MKVIVKGRAEANKPGADLLGKTLEVRNSGPNYHETMDGSLWYHTRNGGWNHLIAGCKLDLPNSYQSGLYIEQVPDA